MAIARSEVGCWVVRGNAAADQGVPAVAEEAAAGPGEAHPSDWCLGRTYRNDLIEPGDLIVRYLGGQKTPAVVELGRVTGAVAPGVGADKPVVRYDAVPLRQPIHRQVLKDDPDLGGCELVRLGRAANPLHLTPAETLALAAYLDPEDLARAGWTRPLADLHRNTPDDPTQET